MKSVLVFCGSSKGSNPLFAQVTRELAGVLVNKNKWVVYGAGNVGLMGVLADAVLEHKGKVIGVIPFFLREKEVCHEGLTELYVVDSMHERKLKMAELSDSVIVLPGGYGTMDELFEMLTLVQLGQDDRPIGILNVNGYYDPLIKQVKRMYQERFLKEFHLNLLVEADNIEDLIDKMESFEPGQTAGKWI